MTSHQNDQESMLHMLMMIVLLLLLDHLHRAVSSHRTCCGMSVNNLCLDLSMPASACTTSADSLLHTTHCSCIGSPLTHKWAHCLFTTGYMAYDDYLGPSLFFSPQQQRPKPDYNLTVCDAYVTKIHMSPRPQCHGEGVRAFHQSLVILGHVGTSNRQRSTSISLDFCLHSHTKPASIFLHYCRPHDGSMKHSPSRCKAKP